MTRPSMEKYQITLTLALFAYYHVNHYCLTQRVTIFDVNEQLKMLNLKRSIK